LALYEFARYRCKIRKPELHGNSATSGSPADRHGHIVDSGISLVPSWKAPLRIILQLMLNSG
jgi:hypothetical protein